jgi:hypothetical protein
MVKQYRRILFLLTIHILFVNCATPYEYTVTDLVKPVAELNQLLIASEFHDYFFYTQNNDLARILYEYFIYKTDNFTKGQFVTLRITNYRTDRQSIVKRGYLGTDDQGYEIWLFQMELYHQKQLFEVQSHASGIPIRFRFLDSSTGNYYEKIPLTAQTFARDVERLGEENFLEILNRGKGELLSRQRTELFNWPVNLGLETIETEAGRFKAVHFHDHFKGNGEADYWINLKVPGSLLKIVYRDAEGNKVSEIELIQIDKRSTLKILENEIRIQPPYDRGVPGLDGVAHSEGSVSNPVEIRAGEKYYGSVGEGGTSYYSINVDDVSELRILVKNIHGYVLLHNYEGDPFFRKEKERLFTNSLSIDYLPIYNQGGSSYQTTR